MTTYCMGYVKLVAVGSISFKQMLTVMFNFQSDFPYAPAPAYPAFLEDLENYEMDPSIRDKVNFENAMTLFQKFEGK